MLIKATSKNRNSAGLLRAQSRPSFSPKNAKMNKNSLENRRKAQKATQSVIPSQFLVWRID